jgi:peptidoglycan/LPS O-acetylase OafA/YrhL
MLHEIPRDKGLDPGKPQRPVRTATETPRPRHGSGGSLPASLRDGLAQAHLPGLDGLRMVAVSLVLFYHFDFQWVPGIHGVLAFFVLSGFLITWLLLKEEDQFGGVSLRLFYLRRSLRIFPAFYCYWFLMTGYSLLFHKPIIWSQALSSFAYLGNYYQAIFGDPDTGYSHTWSLGIEEQFYLLWPAVFILLRSRSRRVVALMTLIGAIWVHRSMLELIFHVHQGYIYEAFDTRADHLAVGCLLAILLRAGSVSQLWKRLCTVPVSILTVALLICSMALYQIYGTPYRDVIGFAVDPLLVAVLIAQVIALKDTLLWRWLNWAPVAYIGALSYSIYLYHGVASAPARRILAASSAPIRVIAMLACIIVVASLSYHVIEKPFLRLKGVFASRLKGVRRTAPGPMGSETHFAREI